MAVTTLSNPTIHGRSKDTITAFPDMAVAITPHDTDTLSLPVTIYAGTSGNVACYPMNSASPVTVAVQAGGFVPFRTMRVLSTGTTATGLIGVY
jgi:hypothetical protein